jgi:hypothetical protein
MHVVGEHLGKLLWDDELEGRFALAVQGERRALRERRLKNDRLGQEEGRAGWCPTPRYGMRGAVSAPLIGFYALGGIEAPFAAVVLALSAASGAFGVHDPQIATPAEGAEQRWVRAPSPASGVGAAILA